MFSNGLMTRFLSAYMTKSSISPVFGPYSLRTCVDNGAQLVQRRKLPVPAAEAALANTQSTTRLVLNADGTHVDWGRGILHCEISAPEI